MEKQGIIIHIPESLSHLPVQILRTSNHSQLIFALESETETYADELKRKYVFVVNSGMNVPFVSLSNVPL